MAEEKRKRGRPRKDPSQLKQVVVKKTTSGKRGRPRKDGPPKEELLTYNSPPIELKKSLGKKYLGISGIEYDDEFLQKYYKKIEETPLDKFSGRGFDIFKELFIQVKNESSIGTDSESNSNNTQ